MFISISTSSFCMSPVNAYVAYYPAGDVTSIAAVVHLFHPCTFQSNLIHRSCANNCSAPTNRIRQYAPLSFTISFSLPCLCPYLSRYHHNHLLPLSPYFSSAHIF
eukprot:461323_1